MRPMPGGTLSPVRSPLSSTSPPVPWPSRSHWRHVEHGMTVTAAANPFARLPEAQARTACATGLDVRAQRLIVAFLLLGVFGP